MSALEVRFRALWRQVQPQADGQRVFARVAAAYNEPSRAYHNLNHIAHMLEEFDAARGLAQDAVAVELAIWFHDAVYDSRAKDSEERSAALAREELQRAEVPASRIEDVEALVLATKHLQPPQTDDAKLLVDCDLAILGQTRERFDAYERAIRREYEWVPEDAYRTGRANVLKHFLARAAIYSLPDFHTRYEQAARANLARSLQALAAV